ncbi:MAG: hypothetical protein EA424_04520 [Planctomycetaceae bacterium]|nr:MAG: hypothetical protein EA424_04520 [Planctomycetaceae bacterium]
MLERCPSVRTAHVNRRFSEQATAGFLILRNSRSARAYPANEKLAVVGVRGMGAVNLSLIAGENVQIQPGLRVQTASQPERTGEHTTGR